MGNCCAAEEAPRQSAAPQKQPAAHADVGVGNARVQPVDVPRDEKLVDAGRSRPLPAGVNDRVSAWFGKLEQHPDSGCGWEPLHSAGDAGATQPRLRALLRDLPVKAPATPEETRALREVVQAYDNLVVEESMEAHMGAPARGAAVHSNDVVTALLGAASASGNAKAYFTAVLQIYIGQDPTALNSIHALLHHLEKHVAYEAEDFHTKHRRVGLVAELCLVRGLENLPHIRAALADVPPLKWGGTNGAAGAPTLAAASVSVPMDFSGIALPASQSVVRDTRAHPAVGSPPVNSPLARDPEGVTWEKRILRGNTTWAPFHLTDKVGPSFHDIGCEIQGKRNGAIIYAPQTVRMSDKLTLELVKGIINQQLKFVCKDGQIIVLKPAEFLLMSGETGSAYDPSSVTLSPDPHSDTGFHVTVAGETRALSFPSSFVRNVLLLLFEVFASLCGENADAYMGLTWMSEYPTGNKQANARLFQAAMNHPTPVVTPEFRLLAAVKYEWANNPSHLMKKLCALVSIPSLEGP